MKQKVVISLSTVNNEKSRGIALQIAASQAGVKSIALKGNEMNQIEVIGDRVDAAKLTIKFRKKFGYAELFSVNPVTEQDIEVSPLPTTIYQRPYYEPSWNFM